MNAGCFIIKVPDHISRLPGNPSNEVKASTAQKALEIVWRDYKINTWSDEIRVRYIP